jgi:hypothetical protein
MAQIAPHLEADAFLGNPSPPPSDAERGRFFKECYRNCGRLKADVLRMEYQGVGIVGEIVKLLERVEDRIKAWETNWDTF